MHTILIVDDQEINRDVLQSMLQKQGYLVVMASNGTEALEKLSPKISLVLMDVAMPDMDGFQVVSQIRQNPHYSDLPVIMVTALDDRLHRLRAVEVGTNDFIGKPIDMTELRIRCKSMLQMKQAQDNVKRYQYQLEDMVLQRTMQLNEALQAMTLARQHTYDAHLDTINRLVIAAEYKDTNTAQHLQRISHYCVLIASGLGLPAGEQEILRIATPMHDVGKLGVPDTILLKPGKLTPEEWVKMKEHTTIGARILEGSPSELLNAGREIALSHHERWDGAGYPNGLVAEHIPLWGRITAVADVFDALTSVRPYKLAFPLQEALDYLETNSGTQFDPEIANIFLKARQDVEQIYHQFGDKG